MTAISDAFNRARRLSRVEKRTISHPKKHTNLRDAIWAANADLAREPAKMRREIDKGMHDLLCRQPRPQNLRPTRGKCELPVMRPRDILPPRHFAAPAPGPLQTFVPKSSDITFEHIIRPADLSRGLRQLGIALFLKSSCNVEGYMFLLGA